MGISYLTSLNPQLFKNIAYVGSFKHFSVQHAFTRGLIMSWPNYSDLLLEEDDDDCDENDC